MGIPAVSITKDQFMYYFGEFHEILRSVTEPDGNIFLTEVGIREVPGADEIEVSYGFSYGPVGFRDSYGGVDAEMLECRFRSVFKKDGTFVKDLGDEPTISFDFGPEYGHLPGFEDTPDPKDDDFNVFGVVANIIAKCEKCGKPLHCIQFYTVDPEFDYDYVPGYAGRGGDDDGEPEHWEGSATGLSLVDKMKDEFNYCYVLTPSREVHGEWDLVFWVKK